MTSLAPCSKGGTCVYAQALNNRLARGRSEVERHRGPVSWSRRSGPHVTFQPTVSCRWSPCVPVSRLREPPRPRPLPVRAGFTAPPRIKAAQVVVAGMSGRACPGLDAGWYTVVARTGGRFLYVAYPTPQLKDSIHLNLTLLVSAYPNNLTARKAIKPQAKWRNAR
jgi:hypothetical protein